jgi:hypothetical protein
VTFALPSRRILLSRRPSTIPSTYDTNAVAYITAVETADGQALEGATRQAINDFVVGCKADGIWDAIKASCILAGARTLSGALVPLVGAAPTNFNFVSGDYNRKTGLVGDGSTKYLDSNRKENNQSQDNLHTAVYITSVFSAAQYILFGNDNTSASGFYRAATNVNSYSRNSVLGLSVASSTGFAGASRALSASFTSRLFGTQSTAALTSTTPNSTNFFVFAAQNTSSPRGNGRLAFYSIGESLDLALLDARVSALIAAFAAAIP